MRILVAAGLAVVCATTLSAQTGSTPANKTATQMMTLSGCVAAGRTPADPLRLSNPSVLKGASVAAPIGSGDIGAAKKGNPGTTSYILSGIDMHPYVGQRVQVIGILAPATSPTEILGSPEAAGTAGKPTAAVPALPPFRVQSVKAFGPCPQS